jgi:type III pantothenate kinase
MNLIIDVGNTRVKAAVFKGDTLQEDFSFSYEDTEKEIKKIKKAYTIAAVIVSKVSSVVNKSIQKMFEKDTFIALSHLTPVPFTNKYATPETLGIDRIALAAGAIHVYPNKDVLVIDAGTCITFDFINAEGAYEGGAISPGIEMRYKALHHYTDGLPKLKPVLQENTIGKSTEESIHIGIINGVVQEIEGIISQYRLKYPDLTIVLTGGDTNFLAKQLKSSIFANQNFLQEGLNSILIFNNSK